MVFRRHVQSLNNELVHTPDIESLTRKRQKRQSTGLKLERLRICRGNYPRKERRERRLSSIPWAVLRSSHDVSPHTVSASTTKRFKGLTRTPISIRIILSPSMTAALTIRCPQSIFVAGGVVEGQVEFYFPLIQTDEVEEVHIKLRGYAKTYVQLA